MKIKNVDIEWFGHATFMIKGMKSGKIVYFDPFVVKRGAPKADLILVTHDHYDHCDKGKIDGVKKEGTVVVGNASVIRKLGGGELISIGSSGEFSGIAVKAVHSYNSHKQFHPKGSGLGYVIVIDGTKIYHAGDTDYIPEMSDLEKERIDVALLPVGGTYTMNVIDAVEAVKVIRPRKVIPMHYGTLEQTVADPSDFKRRVDALDIGVEVVILE